MNVRRISANFVYQHPTVVGLAEFIFGLMNGEQKDGDIELSVKEMLNMVEKYSGDLAAHQPQVSEPSRNVYVVTGTTGGLGCSLLAYLSSLPNVQRIYAVNRPGKNALADRQRLALRDRGYDSDLVLGTGKVVLVEATTKDHQLGVSLELYDKVSKARKVTFWYVPISANRSERVLHILFTMVGHIRFHL